MKRQQEGGKKNCKLILGGKTEVRRKKGNTKATGTAFLHFWPLFNEAKKKSSTIGYTVFQNLFFSALTTIADAFEHLFYNSSFIFWSYQKNLTKMFSSFISYRSALLAECFIRWRWFCFFQHYLLPQKQLLVALMYSGTDTGSLWR